MWTKYKDFNIMLQQTYDDFIDSVVSFKIHYASLLSGGEYLFDWYPLRNRVNQVHFKGAHLDPWEIYMLKLTC